MTPREDDGAPVFLRFGGEHATLGAERTLVSRTALRLHVYAVLASIEAGRPGLITDDYLDAVRVETSVAALELCTAGLWTRVDDGYRVSDGETRRMAAEVHRQLEELSSRCRVNGGHEPDSEHTGQCCHCGLRLG